MPIAQDIDAALAVKPQVARALLAALSSHCAAWCVLSGYDRLPDDFDTDIDFMVSNEDFKRLSAIVASVAHHTGTRLMQSVDHELTGRAYLLASLCGAKLTLVQPDSTADYRHFGKLWLRADEVLAARRLHPRGFSIPSAAHEFAYYLIKRLNKHDLTAEHGNKLHRLYRQDPAGCNRMIARYWSGHRLQALVQMAANDDWSDMPAHLKPLRAELMRHSAESAAQKLAALPRRALHFLDRILRPTGAWVAFMGPDGSGKSLILHAIGNQFAPAFRSIERYHLRPKLLRGNADATGAPVTDPHGQPPRGKLASIAKAFFLAADYLLGYALRVAPALRQTRLILFDRYVYDLVVDSRRVRYGGPPWLLRLLARVAPRPDLVILLDAPAEVLWSRKREVPFEEVKRQRAAYLDVARTLPHAVVVNAAQPSAAVIHDCAAVLIDYLARRAAARLGLNTSPAASGAAVPSDRKW